MSKLITDLMDALHDLVSWAFITAVGTVIGAMSWLVKRLLTNQKEIEILKQDLEHRDELRSRDREDMLAIKTQVEGVHDMLVKYIFAKDVN